MSKLLLCPPEHYGIEYEINPWMNRQQNADPERAAVQWRGLRQKLESLGCRVELLAAQPKLPDMVFTANAGLVVGKNSSAATFALRNVRAKSPSLKNGLFTRTMKSSACLHSFSLKEKGTRSFVGTCSFAVIVSARTFARINLLVSNSIAW